MDIHQIKELFDNPEITMMRCMLRDLDADIKEAREKLLKMENQSRKLVKKIDNLEDQVADQLDVDFPRWRNVLVKGLYED